MFWNASLIQSSLQAGSCTPCRRYSYLVSWCFEPSQPEDYIRANRRYREVSLCTWFWKPGSFSLLSASRVHVSHVPPPWPNQSWDWNELISWICESEFAWIHPSLVYMTSSTITFDLNWSQQPAVKAFLECSVHELCVSDDSVNWAQKPSFLDTDIQINRAGQRKILTYKVLFWYLLFIRKSKFWGQFL